MIYKIVGSGNSSFAVFRFLCSPDHNNGHNNARLNEVNCLAPKCLLFAPLNLKMRIWKWENSGINFDMKYADSESATIDWPLQ